MELTYSMEDTMNFSDKLDGVTRTVTFKVTTSTGQVVQGVTRQIDFTGLTVEDLMTEALRSVVIKAQRGLRAQDVATIIKGNGSTVLATEVGKEPESAEKLLAKLQAMGLSKEQIAEMLK